MFLMENEEKHVSHGILDTEEIQLRMYELLFSRQMGSVPKSSCYKSYGLNFTTCLTSTLFGMLLLLLLVVWPPT